CLYLYSFLFPYTTLFRSLCHSSFCREINYEKLFLFVKYKERYTCSECLKKFVKKKGKICSGCNKEINTEGLCNDCLQWKQKYVGDRKSTRMNSSNVSISY